MSAPDILLTVEELEAAAQASLALDRACCAPIPHNETVEQIYMLGFAAGANWMLKRLFCGL